MVINKERLEFIKYKVNALRKYLDIKKYPIKTEDLILNKYYGKCLLRYMELSDSVDAVSEYCIENNLYVIVVNTKKVRSHLMKRLNFSLAHELGHYVLEHYKEYMNDLSPERRRELEEEADEFAGLFLVNEYKLLNMWKMKTADLSDYFFVSSQVVSIRRQGIRIHNRYDLFRKLVRI